MFVFHFVSGWEDESSYSGLLELVVVAVMQGMCMHARKLVDVINCKRVESIHGTAEFEGNLFVTTCELSSWLSRLE